MHWTQFVCLLLTLNIVGGDVIVPTTLFTSRPFLNHDKGEIHQLVHHPYNPLDLFVNYTVEHTNSHYLFKLATAQEVVSASCVVSKPAAIVGSDERERAKVYINVLTENDEAADRLADILEDHDREGVMIIHPCDNVNLHYVEDVSVEGSTVHISTLEAHSLEAFERCDAVLARYGVSEEDWQHLPSQELNYEDTILESYKLWSTVHNLATEHDEQDQPVEMETLRDIVTKNREHVIPEDDHKKSDLWWLPREEEEEGEQPQPVTAGQEEEDDTFFEWVRGKTRSTTPDESTPTSTATSDPEYEEEHEEVQQRPGGRKLLLFKKWSPKKAFKKAVSAVKKVASKVVKTVGNVAGKLLGVSTGTVKKTVGSLGNLNLDWNYDKTTNRRAKVIPLFQLKGKYGTVNVTCENCYANLKPVFVANIHWLKALFTFNKRIPTAVGLTVDLHPTSRMNVDFMLRAEGQLKKVWQKTFFTIHLNTVIPVSVVPVTVDFGLTAGLEVTYEVKAEAQFTVGADVSPQFSVGAELGFKLGPNPLRWALVPRPHVGKPALKVNGHAPQFKGAIGMTLTVTPVFEFDTTITKILSIRIQMRPKLVVDGKMEIRSRWTPKDMVPYQACANPPEPRDALSVVKLGVKIDSVIRVSLHVGIKFSHKPLSFLNKQIKLLSKDLKVGVINVVAGKCWWLTRSALGLDAASPDVKWVEQFGYRWGMVERYSQQVTQKEAEDLCKQASGHLASVHNQNEMGWVASTFPKTGSYWIGLTTTVKNAPPPPPSTSTPNTPALQKKIWGGISKQLPKIPSTVLDKLKNLEVTPKWVDKSNVDFMPSKFVKGKEGCYLSNGNGWFANNCTQPQYAFLCKAPLNTDAGGQIKVLQATYGKNCGTTGMISQTKALGDVCNGKNTCLYEVDVNKKNPKCKGNYLYSYYCTKQPSNIVQTVVPEEANSRYLAMDCSFANCVPVVATADRLKSFGCGNMIDRMQGASHNILVSLGMHMFTHCDSVCLYDYYSPSTSAYSWDAKSKKWSSSYTCLTKYEPQLTTAYQWKKKLCDETCVTNGGPSAAQPCVFPFIYKGTTYNSCTTADRAPTYWCATKVDAKGNAVDGQWGTCLNTAKPCDNPAVYEQCAPVQATKDRLEEFGCNDMAAQRLPANLPEDISTSLGMHMFLQCGSWCIYDYHAPTFKAYKWNDKTKQYDTQDTTGDCLTTYHDESAAAVSWRQKLCAKNKAGHTGGKLVISSAKYGTNCKNPVDQTKVLSATCDGEESCDYRIPKLPTKADSTCTVRSYVVNFVCSKQPQQVFTVTISAEAVGKHFELDCSLEDSNTEFNGYNWILTPPNDIATSAGWCANEGGELASITSDDEGKWLEKRYLGKSYWIGLTSPTTWKDGNKMTYNNWPTAAPTTGDCFSANAKAVWQIQSDCTTNMPGLCKVPLKCPPIHADHTRLLLLGCDASTPIYRSFQPSLPVAVKQALGMHMFDNCQSTCVYSFDSPDKIAYLWDASKTTYVQSDDCLNKQNAIQLETAKAWKQKSCDTVRGKTNIWNPWKGKEWALFEDAVDWPTAQRKCRDHGGDLVTVEDDNHVQLLKNEADDTFWTGLSRDTQSGNFMWSDKSTASYRNWGPKQPADGNNCVVQQKSDNKWYTAKCTDKNEYICLRPLGQIKIGGGGNENKLPSVPLQVPPGMPKFTPGKTWETYQLLVSEVPTLRLDDNVEIVMKEASPIGGGIIWSAYVTATTRTHVNGTTLPCLCYVNGTYQTDIQSPVEVDFTPTPGLMMNCTCNHTIYMIPPKPMTMRVLPNNDMSLKHDTDDSYLLFSHDGPYLAPKHSQISPRLYAYPPEDCFDEYDKPCRSDVGNNPYLLVDGGIPHNFDYVDIYHNQSLASLAPSVQVWVGNSTDISKAVMCAFQPIDASDGSITDPLRIPCVANGRYVWLKLPGYNRRIDIGAVRIHRARFGPYDCKDYFLCWPLNQTNCGFFPGCEWTGKACEMSSKCLPPKLCWGTTNYKSQKYYTPMEDGDKCWFGMGTCYGTTCTDINGFKMLEPSKEPLPNVHMTCRCQKEGAATTGPFGPSCRLNSATSMFRSFQMDAVDEHILADDFGPGGYVIYDNPLLINTLDNAWVCTAPDPTAKEYAKYANTSSTIQLPPSSPSPP